MFQHLDRPPAAPPLPSFLAQALASALEENRTLWKLGLGNNKIGDAGAQAVGGPFWEFGSGGVLPKEHDLARKGEGGEGSQERGESGGPSGIVRKP